MTVSRAMNELEQHPLIEEQHLDLETTLLGVDNLKILCHGLARHSGWWKDHDAMPEEFRKFYYASKRELIHSELSEALEGARKNLKDDHLKHHSMEAVELADAVIRIFDYAGGRQFNLAGIIIEKLAYNQNRADHKPEAREAEGGKTF